MPTLNPTGGFTCAHAQRLRASLPAFDASTAVALSTENADLSAYFETYGFSRMSSHAGYHLGYILIDDRKVVTHLWCPPSAEQAVFIAHGLFDHVGLYLDLIDDLLGAGYIVVAIDFPGHGLSGGKPGVIYDFSEYGAAIDGCLMALRDVLPDVVFAVGQSTGCAALLNYILVSRGKRFTKLVLLAPLIRPKGWYMVKTAYLLLKSILVFFPRSFTANSHDEAFCEFLRLHDPLQPKHISIEWIGAMKKWIRTFDAYPATECEVLVVQGDEDNTVWWEKNVPRINNKFSQCQVVMIAGGRHHLVKEAGPWQSQVLQHVKAFLSAH